jgi:hypothetical protein
VHLYFGYGVLDWTEPVDVHFLGRELVWFGYGVDGVIYSLVLISRSISSILIITSYVCLGFCMIGV